MLVARVFRSRASCAAPLQRRPCWQLHQQQPRRTIVAAPGSVGSSVAANKDEADGEPEPVAQETGKAKETAMTETFNLDPNDPWKGLPDFISLNNRVIAGCVDLGLCALVSAPVAEMTIAMGTGLKPAIFVGTAMFMLRDAVPTLDRSPGKYLMGVTINAVDENRLPHTKAGKRQRGRAYPTFDQASLQARLKRNAHYGVLLPMCLVGFPPDWVIISAVSYMAVLDTALTFFLQRTLGDMIANTAVVRPPQTDGRPADPSAVPAPSTKMF